MYPALRTAVCRKSSAKRPLSETAAVPEVDMKEDRDPRNAAMTPAVTMSASVIATINSTMENPRARVAVRRREALGDIAHGCNAVSRVTLMWSRRADGGAAEYGLRGRVVPLHDDGRHDRGGRR